MKAEKLRRLCRLNPSLYAETVLKVKWTAKQKEIADALIKHRRVMVKAGHGVGKSMLAGGLVNWFYDCNDPGLVLSTAPTEAQLVDVLWKEVRVQRRGRPGLAPKAPRIESSPNHFAAGYTARDASAFQGRHEESVLIIFDEAVGVASEFWDAAEGMMVGDNCYWLAIMNPTDTSSKAYSEDKSGRWHVIEMSALDHPNILGGVGGCSTSIPGAVNLDWVTSRLADWCMLVAEDQVKATDIEWPPGSGVVYRPGPLFECRVMGRWPSSSGSSVWSTELFERCLMWRPTNYSIPEIGCDVARFGDDFTAIHARAGQTSLRHERFNGFNTVQVAARLMAMAIELWPDAPSSIQIKVDDTGVGGGVVDILGSRGFNVIPLNAASKAKSDLYLRLRSELWFNGAEMARDGLIDLSRLPSDIISLLRTQAMSTSWQIDTSGRRVVEAKASTKSKLSGSSPDDIDAMNLAFYSVSIDSGTEGVNFY